MIKSLFCTPKRRPPAARNSTRRRLSPAMSLFDRFCDAVFRLIMLSAVSKARPPSSSSAPSSSPQPPDQHYHYYPNDPLHSEAVADCIEFIKKSATTATVDQEGSSAAQAVVHPLPVM